MCHDHSQYIRCGHVLQWARIGHLLLLLGYKRSVF